MIPCENRAPGLLLACAALLLLLLGGVASAFWVGRISHLGGGVPIPTSTGTATPTPTPTPTPGPYAIDVLSDSPTYYWKLNEASGTVAADSADSNVGTYVGGFTLGAVGWPRATPDTAVTLNGTNARVATSTSITPTGAAYTLEAVAKASGLCPILQLNSSQTFGNSSDAYDRQMYVGTDGNVYFGQWTGSTVAYVAGSTAVTGAFHHFAGQYDGTNLSLYVDGVLVAGPTAAAAPATDAGFWSIGAGDEVSAWPNSGGFASNTATWCNGNLQEAAIYGPGLTATRIYHHATGSNPTLTSIAVTPNPATITGLSNTLQFAATGTWSNNTTTNVSSACTWASASPSIAPINSSGLATSVAYGGPINITCTDP